MKKIILSFTLMISVISLANAQFDVSNIFATGTIGYAKPVGDFSTYAKGGLTYSAELGYDLTENLSVGLGYTKAAILAIDTVGAGDIAIFGLPSYYLKGWYHFTTGSFKPFAAIGLGIAQTGITDIEINGINYPGEKKTGLGAHTELGFVYGGFHLSYAFHYNGSTPDEFLAFPTAQGLTATYHKFSIGYRYHM